MLDRLSHALMGEDADPTLIRTRARLLR
jgi:hypothetical protein